jgi:protein TonB
MKKLYEAGKQPILLADSDHSDSVGLLKTGVFSFSLHIFLISILIFSLKTETTENKNSLPVYRVTIRPLSLQNNSNPKQIQPLHVPAPQPIPPKPQIKKEENRLLEEVKKSEPIKEIVKQTEPVEEPKQLPPHQVDEQSIQKPIPLPMAKTSDPTPDSHLEKEEISLYPSTPSPLTSGKGTSSELSGGDGTGISLGPGGGIAMGGPFEGEGIRKGTGGGSRWGWLGAIEGIGMGLGASGWVGSGEGSGGGRRGYGYGGSGKGTGVGGGKGGSGSGEGSPRYAENPKPVYPLEAQQKGHEGKVVLAAEILPNGLVGEVQVDKSSGYETLDHCAVETVKKWKFIPAKKGGVAILCWVSIPFRFQLLSSKD